MTVTITPEAARAIIEHGRAEFPLEACGLLAGRAIGSDKAIESVYPLPNLAQSRYRFDIDPRDQLGAIKAMRGLGLSPLGNYHSHPETPARPSEEDLKLFVDPSAAYLIVSLAERLPVLKAFTTAKGGGQASFSEEPLVTAAPEI